MYVPGLSVTETGLFRFGGAVHIRTVHPFFGRRDYGGGHMRLCDSRRFLFRPLSFAVASRLFGAAVSEPEFSNPLAVDRSRARLGNFLHFRFVGTANCPKSFHGDCRRINMCIIANAFFVSCTKFVRPWVS